MSDQPATTPRTTRATEIISAARALLAEKGIDALTLRALATKLGIRAPSLYKHVSSKAVLESALIEQAFAEMGTALHDALTRPEPLPALLRAYREYAVANPNLYRLATGGPVDRSRLAPGLEDWAGEPWFLITGDPYRSQALWSFAHGMVILEIDGRYPAGSDLDRTWEEGVRAFGYLAGRSPDRP